MGKICVLHIINSYGGTEVYYNLISSLDNLGVQQIVFVPLNANNHNRVGRFTIDFKVGGSEIIYSTALKQRHRYLYKNKVRTITNVLKQKVDLNKISLIHAGTLCVDGAVAMELSDRYNIPYISAVRNTDVNVYYKKIFWQRGYLKKILLKAAKIIFISPQYEKCFFEEIISNKTSAKIKNKALVMPNGIRDIFWDVKKKSPNELHSPVKIIFAGAFQPGKNLDRLILALASLEKQGIRTELTAVGRGLAYRKRDPAYIKRIEDLASHYSWIKLCDSVSQSELIKLLSESDIFAMPSAPETFGLVYVEALTQGLPIIYAKGQGFEGFYPEGEVGYRVDANNVKDIADKIALIINSYSRIAANISNLNLREIFSWDIIAEKYKSIYMKLTNIKD